ncbi:MAG: DUF2254 domain-containing protein [Mycobacteriaceae bacterium]
MSAGAEADNEEGPVGGWLVRLREAVRTQLWPVPVAGVLLAVLLGIGLPRLDQEVGDSIPSGLQRYLFGGGAGAASTVLDAIASSMITVTSLTFSLTVVTLQLASSQFSPRLLRTFMRDRVVHLTLALFLTTFTYALTVLRTVRTKSPAVDEFVPQISVTTGFVLVVASVIGLVGFLAHLASQIRVETMLRNVHRDASATLHRVLTEREDGSEDSPPDVAPPADAVPLRSGTSGFLVGIDVKALVEVAVKADAVIWVDRAVGSSLTDGAPLGAAWARAGGARLDSDTRDDLTRVVRSAVSTGRERTAADDVAFGLRQLTDVVNKALSPGINDPTTAVHGLGHSAALLSEMANHELGTTVHCDDHGAVRVLLRQQTFSELVELAVAQPRRYGASDPAVLEAIAVLLRELAWRVPGDRRPVVRGQLDRLRRTIDDAGHPPADVTSLEHVLEQAEQALLGRWLADEPRR